jgi:hypothetical protein
MGLLMVHSSSRFLAKAVQRQRWQRAIAAIAMGRSVTAAARDAGVNRRSIYDWLKQPEFRAELERVLLEQALLTRNGLDATAVVTEAYVTDVLRRAHTKAKRVLALRRIIDLVEAVGYRTDRRIAYSERFLAKHATSGGPEPQHLVEAPVEPASEDTPKARRIA